MKTQSLSFLLLLLSVLFSCTNGEQMRLQLAELERQNRADSLMTDDSLALVLADYFDRHGTANEQMRAHYILGRTYYDLDRQPEALNAYQDAADYADTTAQDCDYYTLCRVHGQMGELFYNQQLPRNALIAFQQAYYHAKQSEGARTAACFYVQQGKCYYDLNLADSCTYILQNAVQMLLKCGDTILANTNKGPLAYALVKQGKLAEAKECLEAYEHHSLLSEAALQSSDNWKLFYIYKAFYYQHVAHCDSAFYYYRKALNTTKNPNNRTLAYHGLYQTYALLHQSDSVLKYAVLYAETNDQTNKQATSSALLSMQHLYDYEHFRVVAGQKTLEAEQTRLRLVVFVAIFVLFAGSCAFLLLYLYNRQIVTKRRLFAKYTYDIMQYLSAKKQLENLQHQNTLNEHLIWQAKEDLEFFRQSISEVRAKHADIEEWGLAETLMKTPIVERLKIQGTKGRAATDQELQALRRMANLYLPGFINTLQSYGYHLTIKDISICIMIKLNFTPYAICSIMQMTSPALSNLRKRLLKRMFNIDGSAPSFDDRIRDLSYEKQDVTR